MSKIRSSGGYRDTCSFQTATIIYDTKSGKNAGQQFWGCSGYPDCKGVVRL